MDAHPTPSGTLQWEHFAHGADIGVRGFGATREQAFEAGAIALTAVVTDPAAVRVLQALDVRCEAPDDELLFAAWLDTVIYEMATRRMLFGRFRVRISGARLEGEIEGEPIDVVRHRPAVEVKGATYTELRVAREGDRWVAQTVVDV
jgi:SHS2 domain-containing protein